MMRMPAEWEKHSATLLTWPGNPETWPGVRLRKAEGVYLEIIKALARFEPVHLLVENTEVKERVLRLFQKNEISCNGITMHTYPVNDIWIRDYGPIFVRSRSEFKIINWEYNAWGGKYPPWDGDNRVPEFIANQFNIPVQKTGMVLEGGSVEVNGKGDLLTTESVLLNPNRNPQLSKKEIEQKLEQYLGAENIIWLKSGLAGDDTDGHIDDLARFLNEDTILAMVCEDEADINFLALKENLEILRSARLKNGKPINIETLPLPKTNIEGTTTDGSEHVPASYANFYVANHCVLVPLYDERYDGMALQLFNKYYPDREIVGINCSDLVWGQGSIHCITQQVYR